MLALPLPSYITVHLSFLTFKMAVGWLGGLSEFLQVKLWQQCLLHSINVSKVIGFLSSAQESKVHF